LDEPTKIDADFDDVLEALLGVDEDADETEGE
jgi:hypothetical protein